MAGSAAASPGRIFISYRREETAYPAGWLFDRLADHFGNNQVFKDVDSIELGDDFVEVISAAVGSCDVLLALIGDQWLTVTDDNGRRRLDDPGDFVRVEIEAALTRNVRVIPILVGGAHMPRAAELPDSLAKLVRRQALELSPARFDFDTSRLLTVLDRTLADERTATEAASSKAAPQGTARDAQATERPTPPEQKEQQEPAPPTGIRPSVAATPVGPSPKDSTKPPDKQRRHLSIRARVLAGGSVGLALILLVIAIVVNSNGDSRSGGDTGSSPTQAVIFADHFSSRLFGWDDPNDERGGHYESGAYRMYAEAVPGEGMVAGRSPKNASRVYPSAPPNLRIEVDARMLTGDASDSYGVLCRAAENRGYTLSILGGSGTIVKYVDTSLTVLDGQDTSAIKANGINRIKAECSSVGQGVHLVLTLDGQVVAEATDRTDPIETGTVGLFAATDQDSKKAIEAEFDNFVVTQL